MRKRKVRSSRSPIISNDSTVNQTFFLPDPLQDLTGVRLRTKPIRASVYDHVIERDAKIFKCLAKI